MIDYLKKMSDKSFDIIYFLPGDTDDEMEIELLDYIDPGEKLDVSHLGDSYHIITFKFDKKGDICSYDKFDAVLISPLEYASTLIPQGWYGMFMKKTTTSEHTANSLIDKIINT
jgi:hypothetical protein